MTTSIRPHTWPAAARPVCTRPVGPTHLLAGHTDLLSSLCASFRAHPVPGVQSSPLPRPTQTQLQTEALILLLANGLGSLARLCPHVMEVRSRAFTARRVPEGPPGLWGQMAGV